MTGITETFHHRLTLRLLLLIYQIFRSWIAIEGHRKRQTVFVLDNVCVAFLRLGMRVNKPEDSDP
jgi:hypothetical protein